MGFSPGDWYPWKRRREPKFVFPFPAALSQNDRGRFGGRRFTKFRWFHRSEFNFPSQKARLNSETKLSWQETP
jgi:hypothetical protein